MAQNRYRKIAIAVGVGGMFLLILFIIILPIVSNLKVSNLDTSLETDLSEFAMSSEETNLNNYIELVSNHASQSMGFGIENQLSSVTMYLDCYAVRCEPERLLIDLTARSQFNSFAIPSTFRNLTYLISFSDHSVSGGVSSPALSSSFNPPPEPVQLEDFSVQLDEAVESISTSELIEDSSYSVSLEWGAWRVSGDWCVSIIRDQDDLFFRIVQPDGQLTEPSTVSSSDDICS